MFQGNVCDQNNGYTYGCSSDGNGDTLSVLLPAGTYYFLEDTAAGVTLEVEAPLPPPTNVSCSTATALTLGTTFSEGRIETTSDRYYSFETVQTGLTLTAALVPPRSGPQQ